MEKSRISEETMDLAMTLLLKNLAFNYTNFLMRRALGIAIKDDNRSFAIFNRARVENAEKRLLGKAELLIDDINDKAKKIIIADPTKPPTRILLLAINEFVDDSLMDNFFKAENSVFDYYSYLSNLVATDPKIQDTYSISSETLNKFEYLLAAGKFLVDQLGEMVDNNNLPENAVDDFYKTEKFLSKEFFRGINIALQATTKFSVGLLTKFEDV